MNGFDSHRRRPPRSRNLSKPDEKTSFYFSKNPVNLSNFIDIFINSLGPERAESLRHHTRSRPASTHRKCGVNPDRGGRDCALSPCCGSRRERNTRRLTLAGEDRTARSNWQVYRMVRHICLTLVCLVWTPTGMQVFYSDGSAQCVLALLDNVWPVQAPMLATD